MLVGKAARWGVGALKGEVDGALADGTCAMANAAGDGDHVAGQELDGAIVEIDEEAAFECEKCSRRSQGDGASGRARSWC